MLFDYNNNKIEIECQGFKSTKIEISSDCEFPK